MQDTTLSQLSQKLCMLFLILTAQRCQTLHVTKISDIIFGQKSCTIRQNQLLKQSKPGHHLEDICVDSYDKNQNICLVHTLKEYIQRTETLRNGENCLLISTQKPHKPVSKQTVSRWVKGLMSKAGISSHYGTHSTRAASTSAAKFRGLPLSAIIKTAGWKNARTFGKFYDKNVEEKPSFQKTLQQDMDLTQN